MLVLVLQRMPLHDLPPRLVVPYIETLRLLVVVLQRMPLDVADRPSH